MASMTLMPSLPFVGPVFLMLCFDLGRMTHRHSGCDLNKTELGEAIAKHGDTLIYGGGTSGLMGVVAAACLNGVFSSPLLCQLLLD